MQSIGYIIIDLSAYHSTIRTSGRASKFTQNKSKGKSEGASPQNFFKNVLLDHVLNQL